MMKQTLMADLVRQLLGMPHKDGKFSLVMELLAVAVLVVKPTLNLKM
jgi:hypothetical protein